MVKDFKTSSLTNVAAANVCTKKKPEVSIMYLRGDPSIFSPDRFSEIVAILTAPAVYGTGSLQVFSCLTSNALNFQNSSFEDQGVQELFSCGIYFLSSRIRFLRIQIQAKITMRILIHVLGQLQPAEYQYKRSFRHLFLNKEDSLRPI
jgi:hypothetical protein